MIEKRKNCKITKEISTNAKNDRKTKNPENAMFVQMKRIERKQKL